MKLTEGLNQNEFALRAVLEWQPLVTMCYDLYFKII